MSVKMHNMFSITGSIRFLFLHIIRQILVVKSKKGLTAVAAAWLKPTVSSKVM